MILLPQFNDGLNLDFVPYDLKERHGIWAFKMHSFFLFFHNKYLAFTFICLKGIEKGIELEEVWEWCFICELNSQVAETAGVGPHWGKAPGTLYGSPTWGLRVHVTEPSAGFQDVH